MDPQNGINRDMCGAKLPPTTVSAYSVIVTACATYWTYSTAVCVLMILVALTRLWLPTPPIRPPPYTCHLRYYSHCEENCQNPVVLAS